jgi:4-hydroxybutyrate dehydrogenase
MEISMTTATPPVGSVPMNPLIQYPRVQFDFGAVRTLPLELSHLGVARPLFVTDPGVVDCGVFKKVRDAMPGGGRDMIVFDETPENPTVEGVERALALYKARGCDGVVSVGGGSVIDSAKAVALMATHPGRITDYMGQPGKIGPNVGKHIAIPTTSGTGSEVSRGAGIHPTSTTRGNGINGPYVVAKVAICDPELTFTLSKRLTAATGMDALSHAVEGYLAKANNPVGDALALDAIRRVFTWLPGAAANGHDREARWHMMMASMEAMLVAKGLGPGHALANTFGDQGLHHGTLVTLALPSVLRLMEAHVGDRMKVMAEAMRLQAGRHPAGAIADMNERLGLPSSLRAYGYKLVDVDDVAADAHKSFFNHSAPYHPTVSEYRQMVLEVMG